MIDEYKPTIVVHLDHWNRVVNERDAAVAKVKELEAELARLRLDHEATQNLCEGYARSSAQLKAANGGINKRMDEAVAHIKALTTVYGNAAQQHAAYLSATEFLEKHEGEAE